MKNSRITDTENKINNDSKNIIDTQNILFEQIIKLLSMFMCKTLAKRLICLILLVASIRPARISKMVNVSLPTIRKINKMKDSGNIDSSFFVLKTRGRKSNGANLEQAITDELEKNNYFSIKHFIAMVKNKFGIKFSLTGAGRFLKQNGFKFLKSGSIPAKAKEQEQRIFYDNTLHPLMGKAKKGMISLLFMDAAHFVLGGDFRSRIICKVRRFVKTFSGRSRYNVLAGLDFITKKIINVTNDKYITATDVCELLNKISIEYSGKLVYIILDNARYQKCKLVQDHADKLNIKLVYIPTYSPNLNLIERYWKYVKGLLRTETFTDFTKFCNVINSILNCTYNIHKKNLDKLIGDKVQFFDSVQLSNDSTSVPKNAMIMAA